MSRALHFGTVMDQAREFAPAGRPLLDLVREVQDLYLADSRPWVVGFSGGKDSTAVLQLVYAAVRALPPERRDKRIFVVSSDTLVETPVIIDFITHVISALNDAAAAHGMPLEAHQVAPKTSETFWVSLLGKGYPAPTPNFRWCTERMKINPVNALVVDKVAQYGEVVIVLGARVAESASRAQVIAKHSVDGSNLAKHTSLPNAYVYTPIKDWSADEVWEYLMSGPRPWGGDNQKLLQLYRDSNSGECPVVIDTSTPSCGNSRFGCWTCTVVSKDKAMESLVDQGESWMRPLLEFRNLLAATTQPDRKKEFRNYRRRTGKVSFARGDLQDGTRTHKYIPGPYWMRYRQEWLERLLVLQRDLRDGGHDIELIGTDEIHEIRREWRNDPNEPDWEDALPAIYRRVFGTDLDWVQNDAGPFAETEIEIFRNLGETYSVPSTLVRKLLDMEIEMDGLAKRRGITDRIHSILSEDWDSLETTLARGESETDGGYQEDIDRLQEEVAKLSDGPYA